MVSCDSACLRAEKAKKPTNEMKVLLLATFIFDLARNNVIKLNYEESR